MEAKYQALQTQNKGKQNKFIKKDKMNKNETDLLLNNTH